MKCFTPTVLLLAVLGGFAKAHGMAPTLQDALSPSVSTDAAFVDTLFAPVVPASERLDIKRAEATESQGAPENCDCAKQQALSKAAAGSHKILLFDNNFDYLCDPCLDQWYLGEYFKRNQVGGWGCLGCGRPVSNAPPQRAQHARSQAYRSG